MATCRDCDEEIVWLQKPEGGWHRPLEPETSGVSLEGTVVLMEDSDRPRIIDTRQLAIYRPHVCARRRRAPKAAPPAHRTPTFEELAEQKRVGEQAAIVARASAEEIRRARESERWAGNRGYQMLGSVALGRVIDHACPECGSPPGVICFSPQRKHARTKPHDVRRWLVVEKQPSSDEARRRRLAKGFAQPDAHRWALQSANGQGIVQGIIDWPMPFTEADLDDEHGSVVDALRRWLGANHGLFTQLH